MTLAHWEILLANRSDLVDVIDINLIMDVLLSQGVITHRDKDKQLIDRP